MWICDECGECKQGRTYVFTRVQEKRNQASLHQPRPNGVIRAGIRIFLTFIRMKLIALYIMALLYIAAGIWHFVKPQGYVRIVPAWLPSPLMLVYISGFCEIVLGVLLFPPATRTMAAWGIIALLVAVFPANVQMMINYFHYNNSLKWFTVARLPLQALLIWWATLYTRN